MNKEKKAIKDDDDDDDDELNVEIEKKLNNRVYN